MSRAVYTVTLNPSIDVTIWTDGLDADAVNHVVREKREAGGKGINVSRVLHSFGVDNLCIALAGEENRHEFARFLQHDELRFDILEVDGAVRENLTLRYADKTVKINRRGQSLSQILLGALMAYLGVRVHPGDVVVFAGSLPENLAVQDYIELILCAKGAGARVALDTDCLSLEDYGRIKPWLIKPNIHELQHIVGKPLTKDTAANEAGALLAVGVEQVLLTLGADGMVLLSEKETVVADAPKVQVKSTVGAGDSALAGFIVGFVKGHPTAECVRLASACGTACAQQDGTGVATKDTANACLPSITVK